MRGKERILFKIGIHLTQTQAIVGSRACTKKGKETILRTTTTPPCQSFLDGQLEVLAEEGSHCHGLVEAHNTIVGAHLFERTKHLSLVADLIIGAHDAFI